jgi:hypothetical protein
MGLLAETSWAEIVQANLPVIYAAITVAFSTVVGGFVWIGKVVWAKVDKFLDSRAEAAKIKALAESEALKLKAEKDAAAIQTMTETMPIIADNGTKLTALVETNCTRISDVVKTQVAMHGAFVDLADCLEINACPETRERFKQDLARVKNRVLATTPPIRPDAPQEFLDRHKP